MNPDAEERFYQLALTQIENIGPRLARDLLDTFGTAREVFRAPGRQLTHLKYFGDQRINALKQIDYRFPEKELQFMEQHAVRPLFINDPDYPQKLRFCPDAPILLYYKGKADLNSSKIISVVGTRSHTSYGKAITEKLVNDLRATEGLLIVSGLASGIDGIAHRQALKSGLPTVGVLAHGLDRLYPAVHREMAKEMIDRGGLITEFPSGTLPEKRNFPIRNRIVAGIADVTVVVETAERGGSMITAKLASSYNREVAAFPGRVTDGRSAGCNTLIRMQAAYPISRAADLLDLMNWQMPPEPDSARQARPDSPTQTRLFESLNPIEQAILGLLRDHGELHIDEMMRKAGLSLSELAPALLELELSEQLESLPGRRYTLYET